MEAREAHASQGVVLRGALLVAVGLPLCSLVGWFAGRPLLTTFLPGRPSLSPMTAVLVLLAVLSLARLTRARPRARALAIAQCACGAAVVAAHVGGLPQQSSFPPQWWSSALTGAVIGVSGVASLFLARGQLAAGQIVAFLVLLLAGLLGLGHAIVNADLYAYMPGTGVAIPTALCCAALSVAQLFAFGQGGVAGALTSRSSAGTTGRHLLLFGMGGVLVLAFAIATAQHRGLFDAETAVLLMAWSAMGLGGATLWGLAVAVDRAESLKQLADRERAEQSRMVAAALTHDLRNPLQAAVMWASVLEKSAADPQQLAAVQRITRSHRRLDRLLRSLLDSLALGGGRELVLEASSCALQEIVADVVSENDTVLALRIVLEGHAEGWWDREALFRAIENLLLDAVKYGDGTSAITCTIGSAPNDEVVLTVANRGSPIDPGQWDRIFEPFARGDARAQERPGWGVGLAFARAVAVRHGGSVRVVSSDADKTAFQVRLPRDGRCWLAGTEPS